jgi:HAD superfamily hydrolase (TIGR01484 family)
MYSMKGIIALDIDGTTAPPGKMVAEEVVQYLKHLQQENWLLLFITGRTFQFGYQALHPLKFPYYLAVQNGAILLEMPSRAILGKKYLNPSIIPTMQKICEGTPTDFVIYGGIEHQDRCYYRSRKFSPDLLNYLHGRIISFKETWVDVPSFDNLDIDSFASVKCFGLQASATEIAQRIENELGLHVPLIRDPFNFEYFVAQATHPEVSKGEAIRDVLKLLKQNGPIIAAGDDYNDLTMLAAADVKVVMATAPKEIQQLADIIAPPAEEQGIIAGLKAAINLIKEKS